MEYLRKRLGEHVFMMICRMVHQDKMRKLNKKYYKMLKRVYKYWFPNDNPPKLPLRYIGWPWNYRNENHHRQGYTYILPFPFGVIDRTLRVKEVYTPPRYFYSSGLVHPTGYKMSYEQKRIKNLIDQETQIKK